MESKIKITKGQLKKQLTVRGDIWLERQYKMGVVARDETLSDKKRLKAIILGLILSQRLYILTQVYMKLCAVERGSFEQAAYYGKGEINSEKTQPWNQR